MSQSEGVGRWPRNDRQRLLFWVVFVVAMVGVVAGSAMVFRPILGARVARLLLVGIAVGLTLLGLTRFGGVTLGELGLRTERLGTELVNGVLAFVAISAGLVGAIAVFQGLEAIQATWDVVLGFPAYERLGFVAIGLGATFTEEPIFRGYLQPVLMRMRGAGPGLLITAGLFAVLHAGSFGWPPVALLGKLIVGLVLGFARGRDRPLTAALTAHFLVWAVWGSV